VPSILPGPSDLAGSLGKSMKEFKKGISGDAEEEGATNSATPKMRRYAKASLQWISNF